MFGLFLFAGFDEHIYTHHPACLKAEEVHLAPVNAVHFLALIKARLQN